MILEESYIFMILSVQNNLDSLVQTLSSFTSSAVSAGGTSIPVRNINSFNSAYAVQLGMTGEEQSEIKIISSPSGTILPLTSSLTYSHPSDTPVFNIHYDQVIFLRSITGTAGTTSAIATVNITPDSMYTEYNDTSGVSTYAYKTQYLNSSSGDVSSESDWFLPSGQSYYSLLKMRQRTKDALYNANYIKSDDVLTDWINEWLELMTNSAIKVNQGYSIGTVNVAYGTAGLGTITSDDFKSAVKFELITSDNNYLLSREIPVNRWSRGDFFSPVYPRHYWQGDTVFGILPNGSLGTAFITYSKRTTPLENDTDELPLSLRAYTTSCINYALYRAYDNDNKGEQADKYFNKYLQGRDEFVKEVTPRDQTGPKYMDFVEGLTGMNEDVNGSGWIF